MLQPSGKKRRRLTEEEEGEDERRRKIKGKKKEDEEEGESPGGENRKKKEGLVNTIQRDRVKFKRGKQDSSEAMIFVQVTPSSIHKLNCKRSPKPKGNL